MLSAFALTNCTQEIENPAQQPESAGYPFEIVASTVDTKTVNDGMHTKWVDGDKINLFHAVTDVTDYKNNGAFTVKDVEAGSFTGNLSETLDVEEEYDWYALYPYSDKITTPGSKTAGYTYIGYSSGLNQAGYNSTASLKGSVCPLYGVAKAVPGSDMPTITMNHLSSVVAINVTNMNEEPLTITTASFTANEDIVGSYYIDITGESVVYTSSDPNYVKNTALVNVSGGTALAQGESAILYAAIKPFTAAAGQKLTLSVNGYSKEITLPKDVTFHAGKIKTLRFAYDKVSTGKTATFDFNTNEWELPVSVNGTDEEKNNGNITESVVCGDVTMTAYNPSDATSKIRMWQGTEKTDLRAYKGSSLAFSVPEGYVVTKMTFTGDSAGDAAITPASGSYSSKVWIGKSNPALFTFNETVKFDTIVVEYEEGTGDSPELPETEQPETGEPADPIAVSVTDFINAEDGDTVYELTGKVSEIYQAYNSQYNNISFFIEDATGKVLIYRMSCDGIENPNSITVGDDITVQGTKTTYYDDPQMAQGSKCISYTDNDASEEPTPEPGEVQVVSVADFLDASEDNTIYQLTGTISRIVEVYNSEFNNISFRLQDETAEVYVFRLSCEGLEDPNSLTLGDEITIQGCRGSYNGDPQMAKGGKYISHIDKEAPAPEAGEYELSFANKANRTSFSTSMQVWEQNGVKLTNEKGKSTSNVADYAAPARFYKNSKITVEYSSESMTKIDFVCNSASYANALKSSILSGNVSMSGNTVTVEFDSPVGSYVIEALSGGQVRLDSVTVYAE